MTTSSAGELSERAEAPPAPARAQRRFSWRPWLRALHRDAGYLLIIGLT